MNKTPPALQYRVKNGIFKPLPDTFSKDKFDFQVIAREGIVALLKKSKDTYEGYEVVILHQDSDHTWPTGVTPAHERMPNSEEWGVRGWSYRDSEDAWRKFRELTTE